MISPWSWAVLGLVWPGPACKGGVDRMMRWVVPRCGHCRASMLGGDCLVPWPGASGLGSIAFYGLHVFWGKSLPRASVSSSLKWD
jgi:hypothetical protein